MSSSYCHNRVYTVVIACAFAQNPSSSVFSSTFPSRILSKSYNVFVWQLCTPALCQQHTRFQHKEKHFSLPCLYYSPSAYNSVFQKPMGHLESVILHCVSSRADWQRWSQTLLSLIWTANGFSELNTKEWFSLTCRLVTVECKHHCSSPCTLLTQF